MGDKTPDPDGDFVAACPECDCTPIRLHRPDHPKTHTTAPDARYECKSCGATFDDYTERESRAVLKRGPKRGLAAQLAREDVSDPSDLRTDGGSYFGARERTHYDAVCCTCRGEETFASAGHVEITDARTNFCESCGLFRTFRVVAVRRRDQLVTDGGSTDPVGLDLLVLARLYEGKPIGYGEMRRDIQRLVGREIDLSPTLESLVDRGYVTHDPDGGYRRTERGSDVGARVQRATAEWTGLELQTRGRRTYITGGEE